MKPNEFPATVNGILYETELEYDERLKSDAMAMAGLIYDIYQDSKKIELKKRQK